MTRSMRSLVSATVVVSLLGLGALPGPASGATVLHRWNADGDALDAVGSANGTLEFDTLFGPGHAGQAFSFDGVDDAVRIPTDASFYPAGSFTIDAWASTTAATGPGQIMVLYECGGNCAPNENAATVYEIEIRDGRAFALLRDGAAPVSSSGQEVRGGPLLNDGAFHHVGLMRDVEGGRLVLFADAVAVVDVPLQDDADGPMLNLDLEQDPLTLGAQVQAGGSGREQELTGLVDDARLWDGAESFDKTPPAPAATLTGPAGRAGWFTGDVQVTWDLHEPSVIRSASGCDASSVTADTAGASRTCTATSVAGTGSGSVTVRRDAQAPAVTCAAAPVVEQGAAASVTASVSDAGSGPEAATVSAQAPTVKAGPGTVAITGRDVAGNTTTVTCPFTVREAPKPVAITSIATLPAPKACVSRRRFPIRLRGVGANKIVRADIKLTGKPVRAVTGKALRLPIDLRGLPKGRFTVEIVTTDASGRRVVGRRTYRTCAPKRR